MDFIPHGFEINGERYYSHSCWGDWEYKKLELSPQDDKAAPTMFAFGSEEICEIEKTIGEVKWLSEEDMLGEYNSRRRTAAIQQLAQKYSLSLNTGSSGKPTEQPMPPKRKKKTRSIIKFITTYRLTSICSIVFLGQLPLLFNTHVLVTALKAITGEAALSKSLTTPLTLGYAVSLSVFLAVMVTDIIRAVKSNTD